MYIWVTLVTSRLVLDRVGNGKTICQFFFFLRSVSPLEGFATLFVLMTIVTKKKEGESKSLERSKKQEVKESLIEALVLGTTV